jgi:hypothetical protein
MCDRADRYQGMTVNERLDDAGLLKEYIAAEDAGDVEKVRTLLESVSVDELSITRTLERIARRRKSEG